jgi:putative membrane protein
VNDSQLANDRTFLAWLRTGISLFGLGFVVAKIALAVDTRTKGVPDQTFYTSVGVLMVLSGAGLVVFGYFQHARMARALSADEQRLPQWSRVIAIVAAVGSVLLSTLIVVTT